MKAQGKRPRNQRDQAPTRTPQETAARLREKELGQSGKANRRKTEEQIREVERR